LHWTADVVPYYIHFVSNQVVVELHSNNAATNLTPSSPNMLSLRLIVEMQMLLFNRSHNSITPTSLIIILLSLTVVKVEFMAMLLPKQSHSLCCFSHRQLLHLQ
jgi:hypothetical protein